jgi:O-antigen ligase
MFLSICIFLLDSVAGMVVYFLMLMYGLLMWFKNVGLKLVMIIIIFFCLTVGVGGFFYTNPFKSDKLTTFFERGIKLTDEQTERNFVTIRLAKWDGYSAIIKDHWLLGATEGSIKMLRKQSYINKGYVDLARYNYNAHNEYIEIWATYGIFGLLLLLWLLVSPIFQKSYHPIYIPFLIIVSAAFVSESLLNHQQGIFFFMFYYSLLTHFSFQKKAN